MKLILSVLALCPAVLMAADSTIGNLPTNSVSTSDRMVWEIVGVTDYGITYQNFTNQVLAGMASVAYVDSLTNSSDIDVLTGKYSFTTNFTVVTNIAVYNCSGTNQVITLPNCATTTPFQIFRFSSTNGWGSFILTNATGTQTIRDGVSLSFKQIGIGSPSR